MSSASWHTPIDRRWLKHPSGYKHGTCLTIVNGHIYFCMANITTYGSGMTNLALNCRFLWWVFVNHENSGCNTNPFGRVANSTMLWKILTRVVRTLEMTNTWRPPKSQTKFLLNFCCFGYALGMPIVNHAHTIHCLTISIWNSSLDPRQNENDIPTERRWQILHILYNNVIEVNICEKRFGYLWHLVILNASNIWTIDMNDVGWTWDFLEHVCC